jgi:hypothetical protein
LRLAAISVARRGRLLLLLQPVSIISVGTRKTKGRCNLLKQTPVALLVVCFLYFFPQIITQAQTSVSFPEVTNYQILGIDQDERFSISNNAEYIYGCEDIFHRCNIWDRKSQDVVSAPFLSRKKGAYWSNDNSRLITSVEDNSCQSSPDIFSAAIFDTATRSISKVCLLDSLYIADWSPLSASILSLGERLLDINSLQSTEFTPITHLSIADLPQYLGYGDVLWNPDTRLPVANWFIKIESLGAHITRSDIQFCTLGGEQCLTILNTLTISDVDVFDVKLHQHWMLWGGNLDKSGDALISPLGIAKDADTILYLTYLPTGETRELFRFSSLAQPDLYVKGMAWSPDARTIALSLGTSNPPTLAPLDGTPRPPVRYVAGTLLLDVNWPSSAEPTAETH